MRTLSWLEAPDTERGDHRGEPRRAQQVSGEYVTQVVDPERDARESDRGDHQHRTAHRDDTYGAVQHRQEDHQQDPVADYGGLCVTAGKAESVGDGHRSLKDRSPPIDHALDQVVDQRTADRGDRYEQGEARLATPKQPDGDRGEDRYPDPVRPDGR